MQIYFIRHAQSENNELYDRKGNPEDRSADPQITEIGQKQIDQLTRFFSMKNNRGLINGRKDYHNRNGYFFTHLYSSPMIRAVKTGWPVSQLYQLPLRLWIDLHEGGGIFLESAEGDSPILSGQSSDYFLSNFPGVQLEEGISPSGWWNKPFEPIEDRPLRALRVWNQLLRTHQPDDRIDLFSHGGFFNHLLSAIFQFLPENSAFFDLNNCGITRIDYQENRNKTKILYVNKLDFMPDDLIT